MPSGPGGEPTVSAGASPAPDVVGYEEIRHFAVVPVRLPGGVDSKFVLDTGIGLTLLSRGLAERIGVVSSGATYRGRRMSGQEVAVGLAQLPALELGRRRFADVPVGLLDLEGLPPELGGVEGFLSLGPFQASAVTIAPGRRELTLDASLPRPPVLLGEVPVRVVRDGPSVSLFLDVRLPSGRRVHVEVDSGSDALILDERFMAELGVDPEGPATRRSEGSDETGFRYVRYGVQLRGELALADAPAVTAPAGPTIFQRIIYDGLLGREFLGRFDVTYDLAGARMLFARRAGTDEPAPPGRRREPVPAVRLRPDPPRP